MNGKQTTPMFAESELLLRNLIDSCYDGITITNTQGRLIGCNKAFLNISGLTQAQIDMYTVSELVEKGWLNKAAATAAMDQKKRLRS